MEENRVASAVVGLIVGAAFVVLMWVIFNGGL
jgi:hypothetical protein